MGRKFKSKRKKNRQNGTDMMDVVFALYTYDVKL